MDSCYNNKTWRTLLSALLVEEGTNSVCGQSTTNLLRGRMGDQPETLSHLSSFLLCVTDRHSYAFGNVLNSSSSQDHYGQYNDFRNTGSEEL